MADYRRLEPGTGGLTATLRAICVLLAPWLINAQVLAQPSACGGDYVCLPDASAAEPTARAHPTILTRAAAIADDRRCPLIPVDVIAESPEEHRVVCSAASAALELLGQCGIAPRGALHLEVLRLVRHPFGKHAIFGYFDNKLETIFVVQETTVPSLAAGTPYGELPHRDFYASLIVHEVVHGVMHQNLKRQPTNHAAYEYPAYALQIASLPARERQKFLQSIPHNVGPTEQIFNDTVLLFDPFYFAAQAYRHFVQSDGCAHLAALLQGDVAFIPTLPP